MELKPCPFCDGKAYTHESTRTITSCRGERKLQIFSVSCEDCHAQISRSDFRQDEFGGDYRAEAVEAWNRREANG